MSCLCSVQLRSLLQSLAAMPPIPPALLPPLPPALLPGIAGLMAPPLPPLALPSADVALLGNLSAMTSLTAAVKAAGGPNLAAPVPPMALAHVQASLAAQVNSLNANGGVLSLGVPTLPALLNGLTPLVQIAGLVGAAHAMLGIDLRAPGAIAALQARLGETVRAGATARASATARVSAVASAMQHLGFAVNAQGAAALTSSLSSMAAWTQALPALRVNFNVLSLLAALLAALAQILSALRVNLLAPNAIANLRAALSALPVAALPTLRLPTMPRAQASANVATSASLVSTLNLQAAAQANLTAAARLAVMMRLTALAPKLAMPPGACGQPCPVAMAPAPTS